MHEARLIQAVLQTVIAKAREVDSSRVKAVRLGIGFTEELDAETVRTYFRAMSLGSVAERARVTVAGLRAADICSKCRSPVGAHGGQCPTCGARERTVGIPAGVSVLSITLG